jgi:hypothetical protein
MELLKEKLGWLSELLSNFLSKSGLNTEITDGW